MTRLTEQDIVTPTLLRRFEDEGAFENGDGRFYALILRDSGDLLAHHPASPQLDPVQTMWANDVLKALNKELHHDGAWVIVFTHPQPPISFDGWSVINYTHAEYGRYALIWLDQDADPQFSMEWERGVTSDLQDFADILLQGLHATMQKAEGAWMTWNTHMREVLAPKQGQTFKRAKGERAPTVQ